MRTAVPFLPMAISVCLLLVLSELFLKHALQHLDGRGSGLATLLAALFRTPAFWLAVAFTGSGGLPWLLLLRSAPVSGVYPVLSLSHVLMIPAARVAFAEPSRGRRSSVAGSFASECSCSRGPSSKA